MSESYFLVVGYTVSNSPVFGKYANFTLKTMDYSADSTEDIMKHYYSEEPVVIIPVEKYEALLRASEDLDRLKDILNG